MENHFNCIYCYTNKVNGKKYVGQTVDFIKRHKQHICASYNENNRAYKLPFHKAIRKYGIENFIVEILKEDLESYEKMNYWECFYIIELDTLANNKKGYNVASGGNNGNTLAGKTEEEMKILRKKFSDNSKKQWENKTDEEKKKTLELLHKHLCGENNPNWGGLSDETKKKLSEKAKERLKNKENNGMYGKHHSEETKEKISKSSNNKGEHNPMYGKNAYDYMDDITKQNKKEAQSKRMSRENHPNWNPNKTNEERENKREIDGYYNWRKEVYERDNYTCQCCGDNKGGNLNAHHIYGYSEYEDFRTELWNGITLCKKCHDLYHSKFGYKNINWDNFKKFLFNI